MNQTQLKMSSNVGPLYLVASDRALQGVFWKKQPVPMGKSPILSRAVRQLTEYFHGSRKKFNLPLDAQGSAFQKRVWSELGRIPYGKTCSYSDIASRIRNKKASRAVGGANGKNPICIIVPCHRVISADGSLGGYSGRRGAKARLLNLEQKNRSNSNLF